MRSKIYIGTSLDGYIARKDGDIGWLTNFANEEAIQAYAQFMSRIDAIVIGRGTFEKVLTYTSWPYDRKVFVLTTTMQQAPEAVKDKVALIAKKPEEMLRYLSSEGFENIYIDGGKVIQDFLRKDLVDDLIIARAPILIGSGISLFDYLPTDIAFNHLHTIVQANGLVRSYYERKKL
jgi:dihydrofolate reductase